MLLRRPKYVGLSLFMALLQFVSVLALRRVKASVLTKVK